MTYEVIFSREAGEDLERLYNHAFERELNSEAGDLDAASRAIDTIEQACLFLRFSPFTCRKVGDNSLQRELIIPFGSTGYVAMFEIVDAQTILIGAVRHQRESDYH